MAGPALDPKKVKEFETGFNGQTPGPMSLAGKIAQAYSAKISGGNAPAPSAAPTASPSPGNPHITAMHEAAESAKQKYMRENGVDENGDPIKK